MIELLLSILNYLDETVIASTLVSTFVSTSIIAGVVFILRRWWFCKPNVQVAFDKGDRIVISPTFIKITTKQQYKEGIEGKYKPYFSEEKNSKDKSISYDNRWCKIDIYIHNIGKVTLKDYILNVFFEEGKIEKLDAGKKTPEAHPYKECRVGKEDDYGCAYIDRNYITYEPQTPLRVKSNTHFSFYLLPHNDAEDIHIVWDFASDNFKKNGKLTMMVERTNKDKYVS